MQKYNFSFKHLVYVADKPVLKDNDDDDDNEDDEDYLVMDKASEKQWKLCKLS